MKAQVTKAQFTTSQEAAEEAKEERDDYFANNVKTVEGIRKPSNVKQHPAPAMVKPKPMKMAYNRPGEHSPATDNQPEVYALKEAQKKDEANRGWRYKFDQERRHQS